MTELLEPGTWWTARGGKVRVTLISADAEHVVIARPHPKYPTRIPSAVQLDTQTFLRNYTKEDSE